jgi:hypothetical protein
MALEDCDLRCLKIEDIETIDTEFPNTFNDLILNSVNSLKEVLRIKKESLKQLRKEKLAIKNEEKS